MFAILISQDNMEKIEDARLAPPTTIQFISVLFDKPAKWYFVRGYTSPRGRTVLNWTILPEHVIEENFQYDPDKIQTDWDQLVRKEEEN